MKIIKLVCVSVCFLIYGQDTKAQVVDQSPPVAPKYLPWTISENVMCSPVYIGYSANGAWAYWRCAERNTASGTWSAKTSWFASPNPVRLDLVGSRLQTVWNSTNRLQAMRDSWARHVVLSRNHPSMVAIVNDMIEAGVPLN